MRRARSGRASPGSAGARRASAAARDLHLPRAARVSGPRRLRRGISLLGTPSRAEVDFIWTRARRAVAIEVKATARWRSGDGQTLAGLVQTGVVNRAYAVYEGASPLRAGAVHVLPVAAFLERLYAGDLIG
jgi:hypothetical protein